MSINISEIQLSDAERRQLAELAAQTGKPWGEVLAEALATYRSIAPAKTTNGQQPESVYDALKRSNLLGCLKGGPADLSSNSAYMEGFGEDDR